MPLQSGRYVIMNVHCRNVAVLEDGNDVSPLRSRVSGLRNDKEGEEWSVDVLGNGTYKIMNIDFGSFASSDANPEEKDEILGKSASYEWFIKQPSWISSIYLISPYYNKDLYWGLPVGHGHRTPLILSSIATDSRNHWLFKPVAPPRCSPQRSLSLDLDSIPSVPLDEVSGQMIPNSQPLFDFIRLVSTLETLFTHMARLWQTRQVITQGNDTESSSVIMHSGVTHALASMIAVFAIEQSMDVGVGAYSALVVTALFGILCQQLPYTIRVDKSVYIIDILDQQITLSSDIWQSWEKVDKFLKKRQRNRAGSRYIQTGDYYIADRENQLISPEKWEVIIKPGMVLDMGVILRTLSLATTRRCPRCDTLVDGVSPNDQDIQCMFCPCKFRVREEKGTISTPDITAESGMHEQRHAANETRHARPASPQPSEDDDSSVASEDDNHSVSLEDDNCSLSSSDTTSYTQMPKENMPEEREKLFFTRMHIVLSTLTQEDHHSSIEGDEPQLVIDDPCTSIKGNAPPLIADDLCPPVKGDEAPLIKDVSRTSIKGDEATLIDDGRRTSIQGDGLPLTKDVRHERKGDEQSLNKSDIVVPVIGADKNSNPEGRYAPIVERDEPLLVPSSLRPSTSRHRYFKESRSFQLFLEEDTVFNKDDMVIAVMGPTGTGKSKFIETVTGKQTAVGYGLHYATDIVRVHPYKMNGRNIALIDSPGLDDTLMPDAEVFETIAVWLAAIYDQGVALSGVLFFHRITDKRGGSSVHNMRMFQQLCGEEAMKNVILVTTMWDLMDLSEGADRERELRESGVFWKPMITRGARSARYDNTRQSGLEILKLFQNTTPIPLKVQRELVDGNMSPGETSAGRVVDGNLALLIEEYKILIRALKEEATLAQRKEDYNLVEQVKMDTQRYKDRKRRAKEQRNRLVTQSKWKRLGQSMFKVALFSLRSGSP